MHDRLTSLAHDPPLRGLPDAIRAASIGRQVLFQPLPPSRPPQRKERSRPFGCPERLPLDLERGNLAAAAATSWLNDISTQAALGVVFVPLRLTFDIRESFVGAVDLAEKNDQGPVGRFLRLLKSHGWMSPSPEVREALVEQTYRIRNKEIMSDTKAVLDRDNEEWRQISERKRLCASIKRGDAFLTALIAPLVEHRDIPIGTPSFIPKPASPLDLKISEPPPPTARNG
jgi:hypothetical protein